MIVVIDFGIRIEVVLVNENDKTSIIITFFKTKSVVFENL